MKLKNSKLYEFFIERDIKHLFHANSVATSMIFINNQGLLSRGDAEQTQMTQTSQESDQIDMEYDVWNDIFLDTVDLHGHFPRQNHYGPVLFKFDIECVLDDDIEIWITKDNPVDWTDEMKMSEKYFNSVNELRKKWDVVEDQKKMITIRKPGRPLFFAHLKSILLDDPKIIVDDLSFKKESRKAIIKTAKNFPGFRKKIKYRKKCSNRCFCVSNYLNQVSPERRKTLFLPANHPEFVD